MAATAPPSHDFASSTSKDWLLFTVLHLHGCRNLLQSSKLSLELKGLANRWQQPRLQATTLHLQLPKIGFFSWFFTCTVAAICCKALNFPWNSKVLQTDGSNRASKLRLCIFDFLLTILHLHGCRNLLQSSKLSAEIKGLANRWQQPRLQATTLHLRLPKIGCSWLFVSCTVAAICCKALNFLQNFKVLQTDGSSRASKLRLCIFDFLFTILHLHGCRNLLQSFKFRSELEGLANRWQQPRLQATTLHLWLPSLSTGFSSPSNQVGSPVLKCGNTGNWHVVKLVVSYQNKLIVTITIARQTKNDHALRFSSQTMSSIPLPHLIALVPTATVEPKLCNQWIQETKGS